LLTRAASCAHCARRKRLTAVGPLRGSRVGGASVALADESRVLRPLREAEEAHGGGAAPLALVQVAQQLRAAPLHPAPCEMMLPLPGLIPKLIKKSHT
jgi:hypothetical protein